MGVSFTLLSDAGGTSKCHEKAFSWLVVELAQTSGGSTLSQSAGILLVGIGHRTPPAGQRTGFRGGALNVDVRQLLRRLLGVIALVLLVPNFATAAPDEKSASTSVTQVREELWGIPAIIPMLAYTVRPVGDGRFPQLVMNLGVSHDQRSEVSSGRVPACITRIRRATLISRGVGYGTLMIGPERVLFGLFFRGLATVRMPIRDAARFVGRPVAIEEIEPDLLQAREVRA